MKRKLKGFSILMGVVALSLSRPEFAAAQDAPVPLPSDATTQPTAPVVSSSGYGSVVEPATQPSKLLTFNFKNASLDAVLDYLSQNAGFTVIKIKAATGTVTMFTRT